MPKIKVAHHLPSNTSRTKNTSTGRAMKVISTAALTLLLVTASQATFALPSNTTTIRALAHKKNLLIGSGAINPNYLNDTQFSAVLATQFNSLSPENEMKWAFLNPTPEYYNWAPLDTLVSFAKDHDMLVKGHGLISSCCNPTYLTNITSPIQFRLAMAAHFNATMQRYEHAMDRWDVVTEALKTQGGGLNPSNAFHRVLGPNYIGDAFRLARSASPRAKLFINENLVEALPGKRQELYDLVSGLVCEGVPIDGVALQMHITLTAPEPGVITEMVRAYNALGLEVAIAEMDVHVYDEDLQARIYGDVVREALAAGVVDISFWGFTDKHAYTWLPGAKPLMFDEEFKPKKAFWAVYDSLARFVGV